MCVHFTWFRTILTITDTNHHVLQNGISPGNKGDGILRAAPKALERDGIIILTSQEENRTFSLPRESSRGKTSNQSKHLYGWMRVLPSLFCSMPKSLALALNKNTSDVQNDPHHVQLTVTWTSNRSTTVTILYKQISYFINKQVFIRNHRGVSFRCKHILKSHFKPNADQRLWSL